MAELDRDRRDGLVPRQHLDGKHPRRGSTSVGCRSVGVMKAAMANGSADDARQADAAYLAEVRTKALLTSVAAVTTSPRWVA